MSRARPAPDGQTDFALVAQRIRASDYGSEGWGFESLRARCVVSRDIPDGCRETSRTRLSTPTRSFLGLVGLVGIEGELGEVFAVFGDDAHVAVSDEQEYSGAGVTASHAEVQEVGAVAQGDLARLVDAAHAAPGSGWGS